MISVTEERFRANLDRVRRLVVLYDRETGATAGRPSVSEGDILRAAVVFLHASLEDLLRAAASERMPGTSPEETLKQVPFPSGDGRKTTFTLADLAAYRGRRVDDVLAEAVGAYLDRSSYNNTDDVARLLRQIGLPPGLVAPHAAQLQAMMQRRHLIAHRVDRNQNPGRGHHPARSISKSSVDAWIGAVDGFGKALIQSIAHPADVP